MASLRRFGPRDRQCHLSHLEPARDLLRTPPAIADLLLEAAGVETVQMSGGDHERQDHA